MKVGIVHTTRLDYTSEVVEGVTETRLGPRSDSDQHWQSFELRALPGAAVNLFVDGFGNSAHLVTLSAPHRFLEIVVRSSVSTLLVDPFQLPETPVRPLTAAEQADFLSPSQLVSCNQDIDFLAARLGPHAPESTFEAVQSMMEFIYRDFEYAPQVTTVATTVADVLAERRGVCQDFAHVLLAMCRSVGIAARYVSGYIVADPRRVAAAAHRGTQASHAWVEAFTPTHGWRGFDPTNNLVASEHHVKMAIGRDYRDVAPTRGTYRGRAVETLTVRVETRAED